MEKDNSTTDHVENDSLGSDLPKPRHDVMEATGPDESSAAAKGGDFSDLPKNYYLHWRFIGSIAAVTFMAQSLYLG